MLLFGEATNPSNRFYEAFAAERLYNPAGEFHGGYGWRDMLVLLDIAETTAMKSAKPNKANGN
jgi:hypothetical protein